MNLKTWASRHPILTYIILTMVWSFGIWSFLFLYIKPGELMKSAPPISFLFVVLGGFGPSLSGLLTTWLVYGREGLQALWDRVRIGRVGGWWLALLVIPAVTALTPLLRWLAGYPVDTEAMVRPAWSRHRPGTRRRADGRIRLARLSPAAPAQTSLPVCCHSVVGSDLGWAVARLRGLLRAWRQRL